jgi:hypothetical protein
MSGALFSPVFLIAKRHRNGDPRDLEKWCITPFNCEELPDLRQIYWLGRNIQEQRAFRLCLNAPVNIPKILVLRNIFWIDISVQMRGCEKEGWVRRWLLVARAGPTGDWPLRSAINSLTSTLTTAQPLSFLLQMVPFTLRLELLLKAVRRR